MYTVFPAAFIKEKQSFYRVRNESNQDRDEDSSGKVLLVVLQSLAD